jgi:hypothetical protein
MQDTGYKIDINMPAAVSSVVCPQPLAPLTASNTPGDRLHLDPDIATALPTNDCMKLWKLNSGSGS